MLRLHLASRLLVVAALLGSACGDAPKLRNIVVEGELAPELTVGGDLFLQTDRRGWWCGDSQWPAPSRPGTTLHPKVSRSGSHYRLDFDLTGAELGGYCKWVVSQFDVRIGLRDKKKFDTVAASFVAASHPNDETTELVRAPLKMECGAIHRNFNSADCTALQRLFDDEQPTPHILLDVGFNHALDRYER